MSKDKGKQEKVRFVKKTKPGEAQGAKLPDADLEKVSGGLGGAASDVKSGCECDSHDAHLSLRDGGGDPPVKV